MPTRSGAMTNPVRDGRWRERCVFNNSGLVKQSQPVEIDFYHDYDATSSILASSFTFTG
jgi:hypothetical protein